MKTTDLLTFFQPGKSDGTTWTFPLRNNDGLVAQIWVFSRSDEDLSRFANAAASTEEEFRSLLKELQGVVQPRGGIVLYAYDHNGLIRASPYLVGTQGYALPQRLLRLSPAGEPSFENITDPIDLDVGDHLVIPVSKDAEARLKAFHQDVKDLPSDLQSSVFNVIRRPSLEWRIERIERTLSLKPATRFDQQRSQARKGKALDRFFHLFMRPIPIGPAVAAALLLMAGSVFAYEKLSDYRNEKGTPISETPSPNSPTPTPTPVKPQSTPASNPSSKELDGTLSELRSAVEKSKRPAIQKLYSSHLKNPWHFWQAGKATSTFWGMAKLQALQLKLLGDDDSMLANPAAQTSVKNLYGKPANSDVLIGNDKALNLLGWVACQGSKKPEFPATESDPKPLPLPINRACTDLKPDDAIPGLEALTEWVNEQKK
ncbi:MAG TPA: hypothetical protein VF173_08790 [Thermoanaerobaculia bacterium]|nr:hypothetical protein [Thermoanaerobaculia bacterium]